MNLDITAKKAVMYAYGVQRVKLFCEVNELPEPDFVMKNDLKSTGLYNPRIGPAGRIYVNVKATALAVEKPRMMLWSYPGFKTDRTAVGVPCHETGHHTQYIAMKQRYWKGHEWSLIARSTSKITSYEPNVHEAFAETMRLFILNPHLLKGFNPTRYHYIVDTLRLEPIEDRSAYEVVDNKNYHPRIKQLLETGK